VDRASRRIVLAEEFGEPDVLRVAEQPLPQAEADEALIAVEAIGVNYADVLVRQGVYRRDQRLPCIPGVEVVGQLARALPDLAPGTRVVAFLEDGGGYADHVVAPRHRVWPVGNDTDPVVAASLFVQGLTASYALHRFGDVEPSDWVLVHAAAGGVGGLVVQLAKLAGARVIASASDERKVTAAAALGADVAIVADPLTLADEVRDATGGERCRVIVDGVGGQLFDPSFAALAPNGRYVVVGAASREPSLLDVRRLIPRSQHVVGFILAAVLERYPEEPLETFEHLLGLVRDGLLDPRATTLPLEQAADAHRALEARAVVGKLVLVP
jgi:NADPH:quinone reductase